MEGEIDGAGEGEKGACEDADIAKGGKGNANFAVGDGGVEEVRAGAPGPSSEPLPSTSAKDEQAESGPPSSTGCGDVTDVDHGFGNSFAWRSASLKRPTLQKIASGGRAGAGVGVLQMPSIISFRLSSLVDMLSELLRQLVSIPIRFAVRSMSLPIQDAILAVPIVRTLVCFAFSKQISHCVSKLVLPSQSIGVSFEKMPYYISNDAVKLLMHAAAHSLTKDVAGERLLREWRNDDQWPGDGMTTVGPMRGGSAGSSDDDEDLGADAVKGGNLPSVGRVLLCAPKGQALYLDSVAFSLARAVGAYVIAVDIYLLSALLAAVLGGNERLLDSLVSKKLSKWTKVGPHARRRASGRVTGVAGGSIGELDRDAASGGDGRGNGHAGGSGRNQAEEGVLPTATGGMLGWFVSLFIAGGRYSLALDMVRSVMKKLPGPVIVYVKDVERTVCRVPDRYDAFVSAFGASNDSLAYQLGAPITDGGIGRDGKGSLRCMLLGGSCNSFGSVGGAGAAGGGTASGPSFDDAGVDRDAGGAFLGGSGGGAVDVVREAIGELSGGDVSFGSGDDSVLLTKAMLSSLFTTRVLLNTGVGDEKELSEHKKQIAKDAENERAESNFRRLAAVARSTGYEIPSANADIYRELTSVMSSSDLARVLSWAISMRNLREQQDLQNHLLRLLNAENNEEGADNDDGASGSDADSEGSERFADLHGDSDPITEDELRYGLRMAQAGNFGSLSAPEARPSNSYERRIMSELVNPNEVGGGFGEVGALSSVKDALREAVQLPLQYPGIFKRGSLQKPCKGVLLFGPPGTGKTLLARAVAAECGACFLSISPATVTSKWLGDGVRNVRAVFSLARKVAPAVVFIDEVDSLLGKRNSHSEHEALREIKNEFMSQWDGLRTADDHGSQVMVLAASNRPQDLDEAVLRRFTRRLFVDLPDRDGRESILGVLLAEEELEDEVSIGEIAGRTDGFSGSDLKTLCSTAAMRPVRELLMRTSKASSCKGKRTPKADGATAGDGARASKKGTSGSLSTNPYLDSHGRIRRAEIIEDFEKVKSGDDAVVPKLRRMTLKDFIAAMEQVVPTVDSDSFMMQEVRQRAMPVSYFAFLTHKYFESVRAHMCVCVCVCVQSERCSESSA